MTKLLQPAVWLTLIFAATLSSSLRAADYQFDLQFPENVRKEPFTGRVYLMFSKQGEPRRGPNWFAPQPSLAKDVENWKPGEPLTIRSGDAALISIPKPLAELELEGLSVQAIARFNPTEKNVGTGEGNAFSKSAKVKGTALALSLTEIVPAPEFKETQWSKLLDVPSRLLSEFHHRDVKMRAGILLPASYYSRPDRRYPVLLNIPGFGGDHMVGSGRTTPVKVADDKSVEFIRVFLDPNCALGHHVYADSANNGPVGNALIAEFIPALDKEYRTIAEPSARFLTGHSSGGWSSLWLQVTYPEIFGGVWSTSPDPVDFRDFQQINMYEPGANMYHDAKGNRRPLARAGGQVLLWYDDFDHMEELMGFGGQLHSFEAVFSPRGSDGKPLRAWDRKTGAVNTAVTKAWEKYDIRLILESNWKELAPDLEGKLHVFMGDADTFYLEGAVRLLAEAMKRVDSDADIEMFPGKDHSSIMTPQLQEKMRNQMAEAFLKAHPEWK